MLRKVGFAISVLAVLFLSAAASVFRQQEPDSAQAHLMKGAQLRQQGDLKEAELEFRKAIELKPYFAQAHHELGAALLEKGEVSAALDSFREALRLAPLHQGWHMKLIETLCKKGDIHAAKSAYWNYERAMGGFAAQFDIFCADYGNSALQSYREVNRNPRADAEAHYNLAWACANALVCMYWQIDAVAEFEKVLRLRPGYLEARHGLARALHKKGDLERAVTEYEKTIEADPQAAGVASIYFDLGDALLAKGETARATAVYGMALRADPNDPLAGAKLVHAAMQGPGAEGAAAKLLHLQKEYPHLAELHQALGKIWLEECRLDEAIRELREAVRLKPQLHFAREQLASALAYKGDAAGFIAEASEARRLNPYPKAHGDFGVIPDESRDFYLSWVAQNAGQCKPAKASLPPPPMAAETESQVTVPQRIRLSSDVQASHLVSKIEPIYPPLAKQARIQGTVELEAVIGKDGTIQNLTVLRGHPLLVQAALDAARQWRYQPTRVNNEPVEVVTVIEVVFRLR